MAGQEPHPPIPTEIKLHQASRAMEISFADARSFRLPYRCLRVSFPSTEMRGHRLGQQARQLGKREVSMARLDTEPNAATPAPGRALGHR